MRNYVGIDLGTTNSAICSYDGEKVHIWKSPEQNDITPSAIYIDKRGNRYYGQKAYNQAPYNPSNSAVLFKRFMGTNTKMTFESAGISLTPEECSAEMLKVLYGYLPEEVRDDSETAAIITVPAAFNQMKKDATLEAAKLAGIPNVALMQEPVAAIMSVMRVSPQEGVFLIYDLGGGTFDVSIAENIGGKVNLLAHGGIEMCGGRDIDRLIFNNIVIPWLKAQFSLPDDFLANPEYHTFIRVAQWATERAKIELSSLDITNVALSEEEARVCDSEGKEMYLDVTVSREQVDNLMADLIDETIDISREILDKSGLTSSDIDRIVFIGGPTKYKPLRDKVSASLSLRADIDINPMTAVAEGASIFAESVDWSSKLHDRKSQRGTVETNLGISFKYDARTSRDSAKIGCILEKELKGYTVQFSSNDTGWTSGKMLLENKKMLELPLSKSGTNTFTVNIFDDMGRQVSFATEEIVITKTLATINSIPASHSIGIEVTEKLNGIPTLEFLVNEGDSLPKRGSVSFSAGINLNAGSSNSINIKIWEGNITSPITDNRFIGICKILGTDFDVGIIPVGASIECEYEVSDSGTIDLEISVPSIGASFRQKNFYSRQEGQVDLTNIDSVVEQGREILARAQSMSEVVDDARLDEIRDKAERAIDLSSRVDCDAEDIQMVSNDLLEARKTISKVRQENLKVIREMELNEIVDMYNEGVRSLEEPVDAEIFDLLITSAQKSIENNDMDFDNIINNMRGKIVSTLFKQDQFVIALYQQAIMFPGNSADINHFNVLKQQGDNAINCGDIDQLRSIVLELIANQIQPEQVSGMFELANIVKR